MSKSYREILQELPEDEREAIERRAKELHEEYQTLKDSEADESPAQE